MSAVAMAAAASLAAATLVGWQFGVPVLTHVVPGEHAMNPLTACALLLAALSLALRRRPGAPTAFLAPAQACAVLVAAVGAWRLSESFLGARWSLDQIFYSARVAASPVPSGMGTHVATALLCLGAGLRILDEPAPRLRALAAPLCMGALAVALVALLGYAYQAEPMQGMMAINTAAALLLLCVATFLARPDPDLFSLLMSSSAGGVMARRVLPFAMAIPFCLGWLRLEGQRIGLFRQEIGTAMQALVVTSLFVGLIWMTARSIDSAERESSRAERALQSTLERQSRMLEANFIGVLTAKLNGVITEANSAFLGIVGYTREDLPLRTDQITPPEWLDRTARAVREIGETGVATPFEKEYIRKDGRRVPVLVGAATVPGTEDEVMAFVVDLSGKRHAERELERVRLFLDSVIEHLPNMVFVKDARELKFVRFNRAGEELLGFRREQLIGKSDRDFFPEEQAEFFVAKDRAVLERRELLDIEEEEIRTSGGETRILHTKKVPILDADGSPLYLLGISEDITEHKRAERELAKLNERLRRRTAELEAANRELEAFSYSTSHDLRAPLRHIDGFTDLLVRHAGPQLDEKSRRHLDVISRAAKSAGQLIDDLLAFSRMSRTDLHRGPVALDELVAESRRSLERDTASRNVRWVVGALPAVHGDRAMLRLVINNLLANAVKYTRPRSEVVIEVGASETADEVVVFVRDNGVGFDMRYVQKLFGVFQRLHRDEEFEGTGIGLANVRRIVERHGGRVWAEGQVDAGATFHIALPRTAAETLEKEAA